jgi:hypothetical protein
MVDYKGRLLWAMDHAGIDAKHLADAIGVKVQAINKIKAETSKSLSAENNALAAKELGVCPSWLATGSGPRLPAIATDQSESQVNQARGRYSLTRIEDQSPWPFATVNPDEWIALGIDSKHLAESYIRGLIDAQKIKPAKMA